jgi:pilus assembly protein CpaF
VSLRDLVRQSLRMRPDRIVVGEVRGGEVVDLLAALNTGHEGGCATVHANSARDVPARMEALALAAGLGRDAVHAQLAAGLDVVLHLERDHQGLRRWASLSVAVRRGSHTEVVDALAWRDGSVLRGPGFDQLADRLGVHRPEATC